MKTITTLCRYAALLSLLPGHFQGQNHQFPTWIASRLSLHALWERSPIIAVGEVVNPVEYGEQTVQRLPDPVSESLHKLFWCVADFNAVAVVKGELSSQAKRFLWASVNPGCRLFYGNRRSYEKRVTRIWFLREDGEFLRPESDGSAFFYGLFAKWDKASGVQPKKTVAELLLTPSANAETLEEYSNAIWELGDFACSLLGEAECVSRLMELSHLGNPSLREAACRYLRVQQRQSCEAR